MINTIDSIKLKTHSQDSIPSFIRKTYDILEEAKFPDIIDWNADGTALVIKKAPEFCQKVLPLYFKHNNLTSFVRQLNMYNFHKRRTQNLDQVYSHELFQRGKRHLLKEIKRKTHDQTLEKAPKTTEAFDFSQQSKDINTLSYENHILKRLYNDTLAKLNVLEGDIRELTTQNQSLWAQLYQNQDHVHMGSSLFLNTQEKQNSLTQDQLPMTFGEIYIPPLRLGVEKQVCTQYENSIVKTDSVACFFNVNDEETSDSTVASHSSPSIQPYMESDKFYEFTESTSSVDDQDFSQSQQIPLETLAPSRQEMSIGQLLSAWGNDVNGENKGGLLGKRPLESVKTDDIQSHEMFEPMSKYLEVSCSDRKVVTNNAGIECQEIMRKEYALGSEYDFGMDMIDFNWAC